MERARLWRRALDFAAAVRRRAPARRSTTAARRSSTRAIAGYNDTVLHAVQQTADQLTRLDALAREQRDQQQTLEATEAAYKLAEERYRAGLASYLSVLNAETQVLAARQSMVDILASQAVARVTLLLAVGGSFDPRAVRMPPTASRGTSPTRTPTEFPQF